MKWGGNNEKSQVEGGILILLPSLQLSVPSASEPLFQGGLYSHPFLSNLLIPSPHLTFKGTIPPWDHLSVSKTGSTGRGIPMLQGALI